MTAAQCTESLQPPRSSATSVLPNAEHDAHNETATMFSHGPSEILSIAISPHESLIDFHETRPAIVTKHAQTQTPEHQHPRRGQQAPPHPTQSNLVKKQNGETRGRRIQFREFAEQLRQQQYFENRKTLLRQRKRLLQKTITLSARLHRVGAWVGDGLVEIAQQPDAACFGRVHQHMQNLIDLSYSQWDRELHALDPLGNTNTSTPEAAGSSDVLTELSSSARANLFELLFYLRSNPRFLVERFKVLAPPQIKSLWSAPKFDKPSNTSESHYGSFMQAPGRVTGQKIQSYSKRLEEYASSFERSNPLSFLLFNMYGTNQSSLDAENQLRLSTWSTVCAELMMTSRHAYHTLTPQLLDCFASLYEWRARDSVQLFFMDILQRGAFLLDQTYDSNHFRRYSMYSPIMTQQAQEFFDTAVHGLFDIFARFDGGFPTGALKFASAVLHKLPFAEQMEFRGYFFSEWFLEKFLRTMMTFPENENMLLKFHVSSNAREKILAQLYNTVRDRVHDVYTEQPSRPVDPAFRVSVETVVGTVDSMEASNPYAHKNAPVADAEDYPEASITISATEIVQVLESLSPQVMHGTRPDHYLFERGSVYGQYVQASSRFDKLRTDLIQILEPGSSTTDAHPCQEQWLQVDVDCTGKLKLSQKISQSTNSSSDLGNGCRDKAQQAALRLFTDQASDMTGLGSKSYRNDLLNSPSVDTLFREMADSATAKLDPISATYWYEALDTLKERYPLSDLVHDDTALLSDMLQISKAIQAKCRECCSKLETQMSVMEDTCLKIRSTNNKSIDRIESLRLKIWYSVDVLPSPRYIDAKNITRALNNMATSIPRSSRPASSSSYSSRPMSTTSSLIDQPYKDTMNMMKASSLHGGPRKLADEQIKLTKNWLEQAHIENFCKGEERIHRFCMEVFMVSKILVGETLAESPVLWASDLFARERGLFDVRSSFSVVSAPASTRPASIISDTLSTTHRILRPVLRSADSQRMAPFESPRSNLASRISRDCLPPELALSIGTLSRAHSATTAESISSVFTPLTSNARSQTSASIYSRPTSVVNDPGLSRFTDTARAKSKFLEKVQSVLVCLLLSDLGCPVWSVGSETDAMLDSSRNMLAVESRLSHRMIAEALADEPRRHGVQTTDAKIRPRSTSLSTPHYKSDIDGEDSSEHANVALADHLIELNELLSKLSQQVDPLEKLTVVEEFYELSLTTLKPRMVPQNLEDSFSQGKRNKFRRNSLDSSTSQSLFRPSNQCERVPLASKRSYQSASAQEIVQHIKSDLAKLRPKTLFRDLQYVSSFVPAERAGKALWQVGLAALNYKDEVCRSMVDIADRMLCQNHDAKSREQIMPRVAEFWMFAAREGNAVAQREIASLYLSRPGLLPIMSSPLSMPSEVFTTNTSWYGSMSRHTDMQSLSLALHWMQRASSQGDRLARQMLEEREGSISIR